jgi:NAD(P)H dehydrogenase (quinone)
LRTKSNVQAGLGKDSAGSGKRFSNGLLYGEVRHPVQDPMPPGAIEGEMLISIVYDSGNGHTARQAQAVAEGVDGVPGTQSMLIAVSDSQIPWETLETSDAIIFGSPTYNGMLSAKLKQFFEDSTKPAWRELKWRNKIAAGFTNSGAHSGDKLNTLTSMALFAAQHAMIWVGLDLKPGHSRRNSSANELNRLGSWLGGNGPVKHGRWPGGRSN